jgi:hypothetical protein
MVAGLRSNPLGGGSSSAPADAVREGSAGVGDIIAVIRYEYGQMVYQTLIQ